MSRGLTSPDEPSNCVAFLDPRSLSTQSFYGADKVAAKHCTISERIAIE